MQIFFFIYKFIRTFAAEMTPEEYIQLKAFARQDGALLSLLLIGSFTCYIQGMTNPLMAMTAVLLITISPFYAANRLRHFRDQAREGIISFLRGYAYTALLFFYAGVLLAAAVFVYFNFIDDGFLLSHLTSVVHSEEGHRLVEAYGMEQQMNESIKMMAEMRPIDYAVNMLTLTITGGLLLGVPIAASTRRNKLNVKN